MRYDQSSGKQSYFAMQEDRCAPRAKVKIEARLRISGRPSNSVMVRDISIAGFCCDYASLAPAGSLCWLKLPGLESLAAEVMWSDGRQVGCAFNTMLSQFVLAALADNYAEIAGLE